MKQNRLVPVAMVLMAVFFPSCIRNKGVATSVISLMEPSAAEEEVVEEVVVLEDEFESSLDIPLYFGFNTEFSEGLEDSLMVPPSIPGVIYKTTGCYHMAVRTPEDKSMLEWTSARLKEFAESCETYTDGEIVIHEVPLCPRPSSGKAVCEYYYDILKTFPPNHLDSLDTPIEQRALLLADVMDTKRYCTMEEYTWYDWLSAGNNIDWSWITIDRKTGKALEFSDIVKEKKTDDFMRLVLKHLLSTAHFREWHLDSNGKYSGGDGTHLIDNMSGIALMPDGVVVYFHPYAIGAGVEGQFNVLVPYSELKGMLKVEGV